jgi:Mg-chelatase subunit ChlD
MFFYIFSGCAVGALDLAFVLDDSGSVDDEEFGDVIKFVTYMIDAFPGISARGTRVGVVMFSTDAEISIAFDRYYQRKQLIAAVEGLTRKRGKTFINTGLDKANELFTPARGSRNDASKVLVLMTDGKSKGNVAPPAQRLRDKGVRVIVVGVGNVDQRQLEQIAGVEENVFKVPTFKGLEPVIAKLIPASCPRPRG